MPPNAGPTCDSWIPGKPRKRERASCSATTSSKPSRAIASRTWIPMDRGPDGARATPPVRTPLEHLVYSRTAAEDRDAAHVPTPHVENPAASGRDLPRSPRDRLRVVGCGEEERRGRAQAHRRTRRSDESAGADREVPRGDRHADPGLEQLLPVRSDGRGQAQDERPREEPLRGD